MILRKSKTIKTECPECGPSVYRYVKEIGGNKRCQRCGLLYY